MKTPPTVTTPHPPRSPVPFAAILAATVALALAACGGGSDGTSSDPGAPPVEGDVTGTDPDPVAVPGTGAEDADGLGSSDPDPEALPPIAGDIAFYGVVAVGDEGGEASGDALASFSRLSTSVGAAAFGAALAPSEGTCTIERDDGRPDLMSLSRLYLPVPAAVSLEAVDAGESVLLSSGSGSWLELQGRPSDAFYTRPFDRAEPDGAVPDDLVANVTGATFPAFLDVPLPTVTPLVGIDRAGGGGITRDTRFTWRASGLPNVRVRIESTTAGGFFIGMSTTVTCLAPDTGEFGFPTETRAALGADFDGAEPDYSRIAIDSVQRGDALLVLVRESFVP